MRSLIAGFCAFAAVVFAAPPAPAQTYPAQPIKIIVTFPAGGAADMLARAIGQKLGENLKQGVVIENRPGGAGNIGMTAVARATPDGYTLGVGTLSSLAINPVLSKNMAYDARKDFAPLAMMTELHIVLPVPADLPVNNLSEYVAYAKKNPDRMNYSSNGPGSSGHIIGELMKRKFGFEAAHVPYGGDAPILNALMGNHIQAGILAAPAAAEFVKAGRVKAIAVTSAKRSPVLPDTPTLAELGSPELVASTWFGLMSAAATPKPIVEFLNREINKAMASPETLKVFSSGGLAPVTMTLSQFDAFVRSEQDKWAEIVKTLGISVEL